MTDFDPAQLTRDFGNWQSEARACRGDCALFDFSFMSRVVLRGEGAARVLSGFQNRPLDDMRANSIRYGLRIDSSNRVVSDLTLWRHSDGGIEVMTGRRADLATLLAMKDHDVQCIDLSEESAIFAVQGPGSLKALGAIADRPSLAKLDYFQFAALDVAGIPCQIGRLGYTGERGFEIIAPSTDRNRLWDALAQRAQPAGFAAIDSLRIEAGFLLFANDLALTPTPTELGVGPTVNCAGDNDRISFVCCTARTRRDPVLWRSSEPCPELPVGNEIVVTSACYSLVAQSVLLLGFSHPDADPACRWLIRPEHLSM